MLGLIQTNTSIQLVSWKPDGGVDKDMKSLTQGYVNLAEMFYKFNLCKTSVGKISFRVIFNTGKYVLRPQKKFKKNKQTNKQNKNKKPVLQVDIPSK